MNGTVIIENAKVLNIVERVSDDNQIHWTELVTMQDSDINTITIDQETAKILEKDNTYDLVMRISEIIKSSRNGQAYKANKFKIIGAYSKE